MFIVRILGGRAFGLDRLVDGVSIQCLLITDETVCFRNLLKFLIPLNMEH